jgi:hypothetical protein
MLNYQLTHYQCELRKIDPKRIGHNYEFCLTENIESIKRQSKSASTKIEIYLF